MVEAKILIRAEENSLPREKLVKQIEEKLQETSMIYMEGETGCGKTTAVFHFLKKQEGSEKAYYQFDSNDNEEDFCCKGLTHMAKTAGIFRNDAEWKEQNPVFNKIGVFFYRFLEKIEKSSGQYYVVFDQLQEIGNQEINRQIGLFLQYLPVNCKVILISREKMPEEWKELLYKGKIAIIPVQQLLFDKREIWDYFYKKKKRITVAQSNAIYEKTGGWPGAVAMFALFKTKEMKNLQEGSAQFYFFVKERIWKKLSEKEKKILQYGSIVPFFNEDFCQQVFHIQVKKEELFDLVNEGLLTLI